MKKLLFTVVAVLLVSLSMSAQQLSEKERKLLDVPEKNRVSNQADSISYSQALQSWKSVKDVNHWIGKYFHYDIARAIALGSKKEQGPKPSIFSPEEMYSTKSGICVDLSRFAFETIKSIAPNSEIQYLMIDFEPIEIQGSIIRKHWVVVYKEQESYFVTADSKRPGTISGPYDTIESFIEEYEIYRKRSIVSFKLLDDYKKKMKKKLAKVKKEDKGNEQGLKGKSF